MATIKISAMAAAAALDGTELVEAVQAGANKKATAGDLATLARRRPINNQAGTSYTLVLADAGSGVRMSNAAAITLTIPTNALVAFPIGTVVLVRQVGAGQVTVSGAGVTINVPAGFLAKTAGQHAAAELHKVAADEWDLRGNLAV